jgi:transcriptional regulator GlxA family with amidase domain
MEEISGLSARSLQLAFQKHFGMRPKQWVQHERLHEAYRIIKIGHEEMSMTELSYSLGFASPSLFAQAYRKKFGELPSMTKKNRE